MYVPRIVEAAIAAVVTLVLALLIAWKAGVGLVLFPAIAVLAVFLATLLRKGSNPRPPARRPPARSTKTAKS